MAVVVLVALIVSLAAAVATGTFAVRRALELLRAARDVAGEIGFALDRVTLAADRVSAKAAATGDRSALELPLARLGASTARLRVLLAAWGEVRGAAGRLGSVVPRK